MPLGEGTQRRTGKVDMAMALNDLINKIFGKDDKTPKAIAKDRLRLVIVQDRAAVPESVMDDLRAEMLQLLRKYFELDEAASVAVERTEDVIALVANVPIRRVRLAANGSGDASAVGTVQ